MSKSNIIKFTELEHGFFMGSDKKVYRKSNGVLTLSSEAEYKTKVDSIQKYKDSWNEESEIPDNIITLWEAETEVIDDLQNGTTSNTDREYTDNTIGTYITDPTSFSIFEPLHHFKESMSFGGATKILSREVTVSDFIRMLRQKRPDIYEEVCPKYLAELNVTDEDISLAPWKEYRGHFYKHIILKQDGFEIVVKFNGELELTGIETKHLVTHQGSHRRRGR